MELAGFLIGPLVLTVAAESVAAFIIGVRGRRQFIVIFVMNLITNPLINLALRCLRSRADIGGMMYYVIVFLFEMIVVWAEGKIIGRFFSRRIMDPYLLSFCLNLSSFTAGMIFYGLLRCFAASANR